MGSWPPQRFRSRNSPEPNPPSVQGSRSLGLSVLVQGRGADPAQEAKNSERVSEFKRRTGNFPLRHAATSWYLSGTQTGSLKRDPCQNPQLPGLKSPRPSDADVLVSHSTYEQDNEKQSTPKMPRRLQLASGDRTNRSAKPSRVSLPAVLLCWKRGLGRCLFQSSHRSPYRL